MCEPATLAIVSGASSMVSGIAGNIVGQRQANKMAASAQTRMGQQADAAEAEMGERAKARRREMARAIVAQGESGAGGQSGQLQIENMIGQDNQDQATIARNSRMAQEATRSELQARTAGLGRNPLAIGLDAVSAGIGGYASGLQIKTARQGLQIPTGGT